MNSNGKLNVTQAELGIELLTAFGTSKHVNDLRMTEVAEVLGAILGTMIISFRKEAHPSRAATSSIAEDVNVCLSHVVAAIWQGDPMREGPMAAALAVVENLAALGPELYSVVDARIEDLPLVLPYGKLQQ